MSTNLPSFLYSGMDAQTRELQVELESLGGGDTRVANMELNIVIDDLRGRNKSRILWQLDNFIGIKDPLSADSSAASSMTYYAVNSVHTISELLSHHNHETPMHQQIADWALDGFNYW